MTWFTYCIPPIDNGWEVLPTLKVSAARIGKMEGELFDAEPALLDWSISAFAAEWRAALASAAAEGCSTNSDDWRQEPSVFWIPMEDGFAPGFVIKEDNNGTTYVISPVSLPHLDRLT